MKTILKVLALSIPALSFTPAQADDVVELRVSWWGDSNRHSLTLEAIDQFHQQNPNIRIRSEYSGWDGYLARLTTQIAGNTEPDVIQLNWSWLDVFSRSGDGFYDLSQLENLNLANYENGRLGTTTRNDKIHAIPTSMTGFALHFNPATWEKAGVEIPTNWQELVDAGPAFKESLGEDYYPLVLPPDAALYLSQSYMIQKYGKSLIDEDNRKIAYSDELLEELFSYYKLMTENSVIPTSQAVNAYGTGIESMRPWMSGLWGGTVTPSGNMMLSLMDEGQTLTVPAHLQKENATESGLYYRPAAVFSVSKNTPHPEEAAKFLEFLLHNPASVDILGDNRGIPYNTDSVAQLREQGRLNEDSIRFMHFQMMESENYETPISAYIEDPQFMSVVDDVYEMMDYRNATPAEAAKEFRRRADRVLRRAIRS